MNTLALSIYERTRELGLLRAVGMSRRQVRRVIRYEAVITALIGAVLGLVLGVVFAVIASRPLADEGFTLEIPYVALVILLVLAVIAGILAAIAPAAGGRASTSSTPSPTREPLMAEPPPEPSIPARLIGGGARRVGAVAGAAGLDRALEQAIADAVVRTVESPAFERAMAEVLEGPAVERAVEQALRSPAVERAVTEAIDSEMVDRVWERLLASDEAQKLVERIAEAPEVRAAIAQQGVGLLSDLGRHIGEVAHKIDDVLERFVRRVTFAPPRRGRTSHAGAFSRLIAFVVDAVLLNLAVLGTGAILSFLINSVFGEGTHREPVFVVLGVGAWVFLAGLYLVTFWRFEGETPGMRFIGLNLEVGGVDERELGARKSLGRLVWLLLSIFPLLGIPLLGIARRDDRTGLHDRRTGTTIVYSETSARLAPWTIEGQAKRGSAARPAAPPDGGIAEGDTRSV